MLLGKECTIRTHEWTLGDGAAEAGEVEEDVAPESSDAAVQGTPPLEEDGPEQARTDQKCQDALKGQERNATAISILKRVRMKLQGRDKDAGKKMTVPEQVQWVTEQAMDVDYQVRTPFLPQLIDVF